MLVQKNIPVLRQTGLTNSSESVSLPPPTHLWSPNPGRATCLVSLLPSLLQVLSLPFPPPSHLPQYRLYYLGVAITVSKLEVVLLGAMSHMDPVASFLAFLTFQGNDAAAAWAQWVQRRSAGSWGAIGLPGPRMLGAGRLLPPVVTSLAPVSLSVSV